MCCCAIASVPPPEKVTPDTPLRLEIAAVFAFPDGSMTAAGLRREGARGRLVIERIAGKDYTTLANIERMREKCRVMQKEPDCGSNQKNGTATETLSFRATVSGSRWVWRCSLLSRSSG